MISMKKLLSWSSRGSCIISLSKIRIKYLFFSPFLSHISHIFSLLSLFALSPSPPSPCCAFLYFTFSLYLFTYYSQKVCCDALIANITAHKKVFTNNWIHYLESQGYDSSHYSKWLTSNAHIAITTEVHSLFSSFSFYFYFKFVFTLNIDYLCRMR